MHRAWVIPCLGTQLEARTDSTKVLQRRVTNVGLAKVCCCQREQEKVNVSRSSVAIGFRSCIQPWCESR
eukprot:4129835-Amphidinium_carterae.1